MIHTLALVGEPPEMRGFDGYGLKPLIHQSARLEAFSRVDSGVRTPTVIGARSWLLKGVHVGHDAWIGSDCELATGCIVGGHATIQDDVRIGLGAIIKPYVCVGKGARIGMGAIVIRDVPPGEVWAGNPARMIHPAADQHNQSEIEGWEALVDPRRH